MKLTRSQFLTLATGAVAASALPACGSPGAPKAPVSINPSGEIRPREISWLLSRAANGATITTMTQLADEYAAMHDGFKLTLITTPDRPSYIQKYETLAAANKLPELFDTDATPIALDGLDGWPLERYVAYQPFRTAGADYIRDLKQGKASFADEPGRKAAQWLHDLGSSGAFQQGFSAVGYTDAQNLFTSGRAAIYNMGTWELPSLATTELPAELHDQIGFFTLPTIANSATGGNEYVAPSGIGVAVNAATYDPLVHDFLRFVLERYPQRYAASGLLGPTTIDPVIPDNALPIYQEAIDEAAKVSGTALMPWDTQLDPTSNTKLVQEQVLLVQGDISVEQFVATMDATISENAARYFSE